jgi:8-oxo-dGTP pyrophosphatase MutT (NUDIX family)
VNWLASFLYQANQLRWRIASPLTVGVRALLITDNQVVLVKHTYLEHWYLPGGGVKKKETLEAAVRREALEEVGAELGELCLLGVYTNFSEYKSDHVVVFTCHDFTLTSKTGYEIEYVKLFPLHDLPADTSPATRRRLHEYLENKNIVVGTW